MEKVSVILTTYNSEQTIKSTVESVLYQQGEGEEFELELIAVDDCSTDSTVGILRSLGVECLSTGQNTGGPNKGRNIGLSSATGSYFAFIDHDDIWAQNKISLQLQLARKFPIVTCGYRVIDTVNGGSCYRSTTSESPIEYQPNETFLKILSRNSNRQNTYFGTIMISKTLKDTYFEEHFGMIDFDWLLRVFHNNPSVELPQCLMTRYVNGANLSLNNNYRRNDFYFSLHAMEHYEDTYPKEVERGVRSLYGSRARHYYLTDNMKKARKYFRKTFFNAKTALYYLTSYYGSQYVRRNFNVFG